MKIEGALKDRVRVIPEVKVPKRETQHQMQQRFGMGELIYLCFYPVLRGAETKGRWRVSLGPGLPVEHGASYPGEAKYFCPPARSAVKLEYGVDKLGRYRETLATVAFEVIGPTFRFVKCDPSPIHFSSTDPNAGFKAAFMMTPDTVSFARVALREYGGTNVWIARRDSAPSLNSFMTKDDHVTLKPILGKKHTDDGNQEGWAWYFDLAQMHPPAGSYSQYTSECAKNCEGFDDDRNLDLIREIAGVSGTAMFSDRVYNPIMTKNWTWVNAADPNAKNVVAEYYLEIPVRYAVVGQGNVKPAPGDVGIELAINEHSLKVLRDGTLTVSKGPSGKAESVTCARV